MIVGVILAPILGFGLVILVLKLSLIIKLFHKMVYINTSFGSYLNYFMVASSEFISGSQDEDKKPPSFVARYESKRLIDDGALNVYSTSALRFWLPFVLGFALLRFIRYLFREFIFAVWEEKHGKDFYSQYDMIYTPNRRLKIFNTTTDEGKKLNEELEKKKSDAKNDETLFKFNCWHKFLLKIYSLTFMLEFVLLCNMMGENIFLHLLFNSTAVSFAKNEKTFPFILNFSLSVVGFLIFTYEIYRLIRICTKFLTG